MLSNIALEDWVAQSSHLKQKTVLILSNNITKSNNIEIKATLLDGQSYWKAAEFDSLIMGSVSSDLCLKKLPDLDNFHRKLDPSSCGYSVHLELTEDVKTATVLETLETIGWKFLQYDVFMDDYDCPTHLSFVRPDDGWFPGLKNIRKELEQKFSQIGEDNGSQEITEEDDCGTEIQYDSMQNSFGGV